ncbi:MAG: Gfo/Idh/MocA family oxidoreductase [Candidatus Latescibacterota bacterium]
MPENNQAGRRGFLSTALATAAVAGAAAPAAIHAQSSRRDKPMLNIGIVGCGPYAHGSYVRFISGLDGKRAHPTQMRITHLWGDDYRRNYVGARAAKMDAASFQPGPALAKSIGAEFVQRPGDMFGKVDAVMVMDFDRSAELAVPFLRRGVPTFVNRPFAATMADGRAITSAAAETGTALFTGSLVPWMVETRKLKSQVKRDTLVSFQADGLSATYGQYVSHGLEFIYGIVGGKLRRARLTGWDGSQGHDPSVLPPLLIELEYEPVGDAPPCRGTLYASTFHFPHYWWFRGCHTDGRIVEGDIINHDGLDRFDVENEWYVPFMAQVEQVFRTNTSPETGADILHKLGTLLAGQMSAVNGGRWVGLDETEKFQLSSTIISRWDERI